MMRSGRSLPRRSDAGAAAEAGGRRGIRLHGRVLVLTDDVDLIKSQLYGAEGADGSRADWSRLAREPLMDNISTDEIIPGWCCYWYDQKLGDYAYLGLRDRVVKEGALNALRPQVIVSGRSKGCGSSREHAVYAERYAGAEVVFAHSFERIYEQNCRNVGLITCTDFSLLDALIAGEEIPLEEFARAANELEREIIALGGLFGFNRRRGEAGAVGPGGAAGSARDRPAPPADARPLNYVEKIIQSHLSSRGDRPAGQVVAPGQSYFITADVRFSHEYVTPMAAQIFREEFGPGAELRDPGSCYFFQDHLSLAGTVLRKRKNGPEMIGRIEILNERQQEFAESVGGVFIGPAADGGSRAICHNYIVEQVARPGQVIAGTDSHTCTAGAVGALAFGVGTTDIANAWYSGEVLVKVPEVIRVELAGELRPGVCAKDLMLTLLAGPMIRGGEAIGKVLLFCGPGCAGLSMDERATLCNMAVEAGAMTGLVEPDDVTYRHLAARAGADGADPADPAAPAGAADAVSSDPGARFGATITHRLAEVEPMVSLPGDPRNALPLASLTEVVPVDNVYGGSCTGGKAQDMDMYASVFAAARAREMVVPPGVRAYIQMGSETVQRYCAGKGYLELFRSVGVTVLPPSCGACINAGPGASESDGQVTVSAQNRNFPGRSGPGKVYLTSPYVVAATALAGRLSSVEQLFGPDR
jgi:3-isopropylmalate/(R)-2-methylmalate dehydratase large subunit